MRMLFYKAWRESRNRFVVIGSALILFCASVVVFHSRLQSEGIPVGLRAHDYNEQIYRLIYSGTAKGVFAILVIFLGLGGLLREKAARTASFTLALPVTRGGLLLAQIGVGISELAVLALLPAITIPGLSLLVGQQYPLMTALHFSTLWFCCGLLIFAVAYFLSIFLPGEYTAPAVCYVVLMLQSLIAGWPPLARYQLNLMWTMGAFGTVRWDAQNKLLLPGVLPWMRLLIITSIACAFLVFGVRIARNQDF